MHVLVRMGERMNGCVCACLSGCGCVCACLGGCGCVCAIVRVIEMKNEKAFNEVIRIGKIKIRLESI